MYELPNALDLYGNLDEYRDPWLLPLVDRLRMFRAESVKVAYYYRSPDASTFRYRCFNTASAVNEHIPGVSASWFWRSDGDVLLSVVREADVLVVCRVPYDDVVARLIAAARQFGVRVVFDVDDYVFDTAMVPEVVTTLDQHETEPTSAEAMWMHWFATFARVRSTLDLADEVVVTNEYLAERTRAVVDKPVHIVPNFMGAEQIEYSEALADARAGGLPTADGFLHLGYFSGTPSHNRDFAIVAGALARLMRDEPTVRLRLVGYLDPAFTALSGLEDRIEVVPLTSYMNLQRLLAQTEVNLAPLQDNGFTNCKSELKYFDAAVVGAPTLASPTFTMSRAIAQGVNGLLVRVEEWDEYLRFIVDECYDQAVLMGNAAREHAVAAYSPAAMAGRIVSALSLPTSTI